MRSRLQLYALKLPNCVKCTQVTGFRFRLNLLDQYSSDQIYIHLNRKIPNAVKDAQTLRLCSQMGSSHSILIKVKSIGATVFELLSNLLQPQYSDRS